VARILCQCWQNHLGTHWTSTPEVFDLVKILSTNFSSYLPNLT
jgi:hypothetical protein